MKKKLLAIIIALLLVATLTCVLVACGETEPSPEPTPEPTPTPAPSVEEVKVVDILQNNAAFQNMDNAAAEKIVDGIKERVASDCNVAKSKVELVDVNYDDVNAELVTVVAKIDGKKVVLNRYESERLGEYGRSDKETLVLNKANYTAESKVDEDKQSEVDAEFTVAVNAILAELASLSEEATLVKANEIFSDYSSVESVLGFENCDGIILSNVREDGTVVAFTYSHSISDSTNPFVGYQDHVLKVEGRENMTDADIMAHIKLGNFTKETRTIDPSKTYTIPALEEKPVVEYVDFDEVYNQIFGENYTLTSPAELLEGVLPTIQTYATSTELIMYATGGNLTILSEVVSKKGSTYLNKLTYSGENFEDIKQYCDLYSESAGNLEEYLKTTLVKNDIVKGSSEETVLRTELEEYGVYVLNGQQKIKSLAENEFIAEKQINATTEDNIDFKAFGEKLCPDKEVIATYVGEQSGSINDSRPVFNTGYLSKFEVVVVYLENGNAVIEKSLIYVPYTKWTSTNESLYNSLLNGEENKDYKIAKNEKETIKNATIVKQKESASEAV